MGKLSKGIKKLREYEGECYQYEEVDVEEFPYRDSETGESGRRVLIKISMKRQNLVFNPANLEEK